MRKLRIARDVSTPTLFSQTISARNGTILHVEQHRSEPEIAGLTGPAPASETIPPPLSALGDPDSQPPPAEEDVNLREDLCPSTEPAPVDTVRSQSFGPEASAAYTIVPAGSSERQ